MAGEWREQRWGDLATLEYGRALRGHDANTGPYRVFGTNGPIGWHDEPLCPHPGVIIGRKGAYRGVHYSPAPFFVIDTAFYLEPKVEIDLRWAYYELLVQDINWLDSGSAIPSTSRESFYSLPVRVPPVAEQRAIAHILGTLDDKIELNRRMSETLEQMARALFKAWFVDFEPVRAKQCRGGPSWPPPVGQAQGPAPTGWQWPQHILDLFPNRLVESELGEIPEGWRVSSVGEHAELTGGKQLEKKHIVDRGPVPVFGGAGIMGYTENHNAEGFVISVGRVGAYCGQFFSHRGKAWINNNASLIRPKDESISEWIFIALQHIDIDVIKRGAAQPFVSNGDIAKLPLTWPGTAIVAAFTKYLSPVFKKKEANDQQSRTLAALRDALLPKLISGELRVKDAERSLKERGL